jgi:hypothetical protein
VISDTVAWFLLLHSASFSFFELVLLIRIILCFRVIVRLTVFLCFRVIVRSTVFLCFRVLLFLGAIVWYTVFF